MGALARSLGTRIVQGGKWAWRGAKGFFRSKGATSAAAGAAVKNVTSKSQWFWRALDVASWGWIFYEFLTPNEDSNISDPVTAFDTVFGELFSPFNTRLLHSRANDEDAIISVLAYNALAIMSVEDEESQFKGFVRLTLADYLTLSRGKRIFSIDTMEEILKNEFYETLQSSGVKESDLAYLMESLRDPEAPDSMLVNLDFLCFFVERVAEVNKESGFGPSNEASGEGLPVHTNAPQRTHTSSSPQSHSSASHLSGSSESEFIQN
jgi:hypothetical protein